jgi:hypothetical protein
MTMRRFALLAGVLLAAAIPALAQTGAAPARPDYVPDDIFRNQDQAQFLEGWFGAQLHAMREPVLSRPGDGRGFRRRLRMLVLPSFHHPYAIRVDEAVAGGARVRIVRLSGAGGYGPGRIIEEESIALSAAETAALNRAVDASGLAALPPREARPGCLDGVSFVFEQADPQRSRFVSVHQCGLTAALEALIWRIDALRRAVGSDLGDYRGGSGNRLRLRD